MRIRSIKPEFYRSADISKLSWEDRLLFIGLWSYVDDNGVGIDKASHICADLFADDLERDPRETIARVTGGLQRLENAHRIIRFEADGKQLIYVVNWAKHQRIDRPNKPRYVSPLDLESGKSIELTLDFETPSREYRESPSTGTEEQGNRGTGEQRNKKTRSSKSNDDSQLQDDFVTWYATYPKHVARPAAIKAYSKAREHATADVLLDGARRYNAEVLQAQTKAQFIKHPATWLNNEGWLDEPASAAVMADRKPEWD
jgi:hypothetical protein